LKPQKPLSVFISYAHLDKGIARGLARELRSAGLKVWIDEGELRAGDSIIVRISEAIAEVEFVIALVSKNSVESQWCQKELSLAVNEGLSQGRVRVLPLRLGEVKMPPSLQDILYLQLGSKKLFTKKLIKRLVSDVKAHRSDIRRYSSYRVSPKPLSTTSSYYKRDLKRFGGYLTNIKLAEKDYDFSDIRDALVADHSVPALEVLVEAVIREGEADGYPLQYAAWGVVMLLPASLPWCRELLLSKNFRVVCNMSDALWEDIIVSDRERINIFSEIKEMGDWKKVKSNILNSLKKNKNSRGNLENVRYVFSAVDGQN